MKNQRTELLLLLILFSQVFTLNAQNYKNVDLPDAMTFLNGEKVKTKADFEKRKAEIKDLWCKYYIGYFPKEVPALLDAEVINERKNEEGTSIKKINLTFDTPRKRFFEIEVWEPAEKTGTTPLLLVAPFPKQLKWRDEALKRGYTVCIFPGLDEYHVKGVNYPDMIEEYDSYRTVWHQFKNEYPEASWHSSIAIQAWLASRTLDYLLDSKYGYNIDTTAVSIIGHSRYGKMAIYAGAFDERFTCVVARSSGTPTAAPYRFTSRQTFMETVVDYPEVWALPSLKNYLGREDELPVGGNDLIATIAPRYMMLHTAYNDGGDPTFAVERGYLNAKKAYTFMGKTGNIRLVYRKGDHNPITQEQVELNLDFMDWAFGRAKLDESEFKERLLHQFDWQEWKNEQAKTDVTVPENSSVSEKMNWMLGQQPDHINKEGTWHIPAAEELGVNDVRRDRWNPGGLTRVPFSFGADMNGNIYFDPELKNYKATVIWLHPWNYSWGSTESYGVEKGLPIYWRLAQEGYIVVGYDQFGFGDQLIEGVDFYKKYPHWSRLGRAVYDVHQVVDFLVDGKGITENTVPATDHSKIYICGFSYGGMVGLYATAFDKRIAGLAVFSGFTPMRTDTNDQPTGGIQQYYQWHSVLPKLGLFNGNESEIPYDYDDVIKMIAPRNCLVYAPLNDRFANADDVKKCVDKARNAWTDSSKLVFNAPDEICRFQKNQQNVFIDWLDGIVAE